MYLQADYQNYRRRMIKELADARQIGVIGTLDPFLRVADFLGMADTAAKQSDNIDAIRQGLAMILNEFNKAFDDLGVKKLDSIGKPFDPAREKFETSFITSRARFDYYQHKRNTRKELQNCSPTNSWVREGAGVTEPLLHRAGLIRVPVMLCQAIQDTIVVLEDQETFIKRVPDGKLVKFDAKHELYSSHDEVLGDYVDKIIDFMSEE